MGLPDQAGRGPANGRICRQLATGVAVLAFVLFCASCGGGEDAAAPTDREKAADVEILNASIGQELTLIDAYSHGLSLAARYRPVVEQLRAQAQEHIDGLTKSIRGLGGEVEAEGGEVDYAPLKSEADFLTLAYELESSALADDLAAAPRLEAAAPRKLAAALAASAAQHLVVLRQSLGAGLAASFPRGFDSGDIPPPDEPGEGN